MRCEFVLVSMLVVMGCGEVQDASIDAMGAAANGAACVSSSDCDSGHCIDDVCCASSCDGTCMACSAAKTGAADGTCAPIAEQDDPDDECAADDCTDGVLTLSSCDGDGACASDDVSCAPYLA